jgi:hypothetical protein
MRFSEFDFDVITTPPSPANSPPKQGDSSPAPDRRRAEPEPVEPPDDKTPR